MKVKPFRFKQFDIYQDKTAMKVGTDGVLLGAYANLTKGNRILDIGTGTGLISLMIAQRYPEAIIDAVEIDRDAYLQAKDNFDKSIFNHQFSIYNQPIQKFKSQEKYDLIVSNPPFFTLNDRVLSDSRKVARQQDQLSFNELLTQVSKLLLADGTAEFIIPYDLETEFIQLANEVNLFPIRILHVKGNNKALIKRSIITLSFHQLLDVKHQELVIEVDRHQYTKEYIALTKAFYLKM